MEFATRRVTISRKKSQKIALATLSIFSFCFNLGAAMTPHWYAIGEEPWQPLLAPEGQEEVVLECIAQAMPGVSVRLAKGPEKTPVATCFMASAGSRDHRVVYARRPSGSHERSA